MRLLVTFIIFLFGNYCFAQVQIVAEQDQDRNLTLLSFNSEKIPYTIRIEFSKLENLESINGRVIYAVANPGKSTLTKLHSIYVNEKTGFSYNTKLYKGIYETTSLESITYLVPLEEGKSFSIRPLLSQSGMKPESQPFTGAGLYFEKPTSICAPRKGIISGVKMDVLEPSEGPTNFDSENYIEIYHQDGTFTRLTGLKPNSSRVGVGEEVIPGQVIAESSFSEQDQMDHVKMIQSRWEMGDLGIVWTNFPVKIYTEDKEILSDQTDQSLQSFHPKELIMLEMDKKELKKFSK